MLLFSLFHGSVTLRALADAAPGALDLPPCPLTPLHLLLEVFRREGASPCVSAWMCFVYCTLVVIRLSPLLLLTGPTLATGRALGLPSVSFDIALILTEF